MALKKKYEQKQEIFIRDVRPWTARFTDSARQPSTAALVFVVAAFLIYTEPMVSMLGDLIFAGAILYFIWLMKTPVRLPFKLPASAGKTPDYNNKKPGSSKPGKAEGILYIGNDCQSGEEIWFTNSDARTHILYLGTTGAGKTEGLKSLSTNALCWGSGFIYIDGKADTDLWSAMSALARRFGRDDDLLVMNYMTGNADGRAPSNSLNPFSSGSASYLTNMLVSLMPDAEGDNAMWKERAVSLVGSLMPVLTWKRENQNMPLNVSTIRKSLGFQEIIRLSRDPNVPENMRLGLKSYLTELPGYIDEAFDDQGNEKPLPPDMPPADSSVPRQQHGYLSMQFTRSLQSLGDEYGYIFDTEAADIDMLDVVLQRRIMIVLIPALEKSSDETANLGKIIAANLKGMMGATLGSTVEGESAIAIENKPTHSSTPFMAIFDEVGYYTAQGMAVMAAQARSLGFCLVFAAQDLPALEKRVREEARSITANCNLKIFGKLEDPTSTKDFFEKTVGEALVTEVQGFTSQQSSSGLNYSDSRQASVTRRARASYDGLRAFKEGQAIVAFGESVIESQIFYSNPGFAKAMRVQKFIQLLPPEKADVAVSKDIEEILKKWRTNGWTVAGEGKEAEKPEELKNLIRGFVTAKKAKAGLVQCGAAAVAKLAGPPPAEEEALPPPPPQTKTPPVGKPPSSGEQPLSWIDAIGGGDSVTAAPARPKSPPVVDADAALATLERTPSAPSATEPQAPQKGAQESTQGPLSWQDVIGGGTPSAPQQPPAMKEKPATQKVSGKPEASGEHPAKKAPDQPISWQDVIGGGSGEEG